MKWESTKVPWKLSLEKNTNPHFKEHWTKTDDIWLVVIRFFFSQTNLVFVDILDSFSHSLLTFLFFEFWYSTYFRCSTEFAQCPYAFFIKTSTQNVLYYVLIFMKHSFLLTAKITFDVDNCYLYKLYIYARSLFCKQIFKRIINDCNEIFYLQPSKCS